MHVGVDVGGYTCGCVLYAFLRYITCVWCVCVCIRSMYSVCCVVSIVCVFVCVRACSGEIGAGVVSSLVFMRR